MLRRIRKDGDQPHHVRFAITGLSEFGNELLGYSYIANDSRCTEHASWIPETLKILAETAEPHDKYEKEIFMEWFLKALRQYSDFEGRARRKEYWMYTLFYLIFALGAIVLDFILGSASDDFGYGLFYVLYVLAMLIPTLAVSVRRLHDVGKSGWMVLVGLIPIIGTIWLLVLFVSDSDPGVNQYGANPKHMAY